MCCRCANCALWFLKLPHSEAKERVIFNVNILEGSSSVLELLEATVNSDYYQKHQNLKNVNNNLFFNLRSKQEFKDFSLDKYLFLEMIICTWKWKWNEVLQIPENHSKFY